MLVNAVLNQQRNDGRVVGLSTRPHMVPGIYAVEQGNHPRNFQNRDFAHSGMIL
jgi:hypothetical protein